MAGQVQCPKCKATLFEPLFDHPWLQPCPNCSEQIRIVTFPALNRVAEAGATGENIIIEGESSCFFHPSKRAAVCCEGCGRFICPLCDVAVDGKHLCAQCLSGGVSKGLLQPFKSTGFRYDRAAWAYVILSVPLSFMFLGVVTGAAGLYNSIKGLKQKDNLLPKKTKTFYILTIISVLEILWSLGFMILIFHK
ncbi:MAG: hypothetical protein JWN25_3478 [Verrucomicrobiales bacterium]|nr:hypothetical protein [Verrucomicrobiales bacterium]